VDDPSLTIAIAMIGGVLAQALSRHLRLPGIVLLLATGVLLGPDLANIVRPHTLGTGLPGLVGFAVAIILFEGGLHMNLSRLRDQAAPIRRLVTWGAVVTAIGATAVAWAVTDWDLRLSFLFGTLVIVTGPTVVTPLIRRLRLNEDIATILEAEGIFIDAVGAIIAVVALEALLVPSGAAVLQGIWGFLLAFGVGILVGALGGAFLAALLRWKRLLPAGLENVLSLAVAVGVFQVSNAIAHESGIVAAIIAGMVVSHTQPAAFRGLLEFKEQLTVLLIATLFVLLAADVRVEDVLNLGWSGVWVVVLLMVVVRPMTVFVSTTGTSLTMRQKIFLSWLAPRGIVAAAVASLFAIRLAGEGIAGGTEMRAMVFLVIASTVFLQGLTGGVVASLLRLRRPNRVGTLILGAHEFARKLARQLKDSGEPVMLIDANADNCLAADGEDLPVLYGNGLEERLLTKAEAQTHARVIALTPNESINFVFAGKIRDHFSGPEIYVALETGATGVTEKMVHDLGGRVLFGGARRLNEWLQAVSRGQILWEEWEFGGSENGVLASAPTDHVTSLSVRRADAVFVVHDKTELRPGDFVQFAISREVKDAAATWLRESGFHHRAAAPAQTEAAPAVSAAPDDVSAALGPGRTPDDGAA